MTVHVHVFQFFLLLLNTFVEKPAGDCVSTGEQRVTLLCASSFQMLEHECDGKSAGRNLGEDFSSSPKG